MIRTRLRSPLRWLSAVMSSLMTVFLASITETPALMLAIPAIAAVFLLAPAIGVFRHDEMPLTRAGVRLEAFEVRGDQPTSLTETRFRLVLVNDADFAAEGFRIRLLIPHSVAPPETRTRPLGSVLVGSFGAHWSLDSMLDATAITLRTTPHGAEGAIVCPAHARLEVADLVLPAQAQPFDLSLDYQVSGGNARSMLDRMRLRSAS